MTLTQLHEAVKPQFVWEQHNCKDLQTDAVLYKGKGSKGIASIVFIGISFMKGFKAREVCEYLNIETIEEYQHKLAIFKAAITDTNNGFKDKHSKAIHIKTGLVLNYLRLHKKIEFIPLNTFRF